MSHTNGRTHAPQLEPNPLVRALDNYSDMERDLADCMDKNHQLAVENGILLAEVNMLREAVAVARKESLRLQAVASTFGGQARALSSVFNSIIELAIKNGYEAAEQAPARAQEPLQKASLFDHVQPTIKPEGPVVPPYVDPEASGKPPQVDWVAAARAEG